MVSQVAVGAVHHKYLLSSARGKCCSAAGCPSSLATEARLTHLYLSTPSMDAT